MAGVSGIVVGLGSLVPCTGRTVDKIAVAETRRDEKDIGMHRKALVVFFRTHLPNAQDSRSENSAVCGDGVTMAIGHALAEPCHPKLLSLSIPKPRIPEPKTPTSLALASPTSIASWSTDV